MTPRRWREIESAFERALRVPAEQRRAFLEQEFGADPSLRDEVRSLLDADANRTFSVAGAVGCVAAAWMSEPGSPPDEGQFIPGTILARRYRVAARLGKGGMGEIYRATDMLLGQAVALKFVPGALAEDAAALSRLRNEVRLARQISHPNVCRLYDICEANGQFFLTMEFIDGEDLQLLLRRIGRLSPQKALEIARDLCIGLAAAHARDVLHRDLKPGNIMIDGRGRVLITDFGLASTLSALSRTDVRSGTPEYMAPEQLAGIGVTVRSDLYSLGLVLYELFAGAPPHLISDPQQLLCLRQKSAPSLADSVPDIDPQIDQVITRCLDPNPARRPPSALAVAAMLPGGGDPLTAAMARGETPSPETVAAAGLTEMLRPHIAATALAGFVVFMLCNAWLLGRLSVFSPVAHLRPAVMAQAAIDVLDSIGLTPNQRCAAWAYGFDGEAVRSYLRAGTRRTQSRHSLVDFWYRTSPEPMFATTGLLNPFITPQDPPLITPGMVLVRLNTKRHLTLLERVPPRIEAVQDREHVDWSRYFAAAGLDHAVYVPATPVCDLPPEISASDNLESPVIERGFSDEEDET